MTKIQPIYKSYILRLWGTEADSTTWRARLEGISHADETYTFAGLDDLFDFLLAPSDSPQTTGLTVICQPEEAPEI